MYTIIARGVRGRKGDTILRAYLPFFYSEYSLVSADPGRIREEFKRLVAEWLRAGGRDTRIKRPEDVDVILERERHVELPIVILPRGFEPSPGGLYLVDVVKVTPRYMVAVPHEHRWVVEDSRSVREAILSGVSGDKLVVRMYEKRVERLRCPKCGDTSIREVKVGERVVEAYPHELKEMGVTGLSAASDELRPVANLVEAGLSGDVPYGLHDEGERERLYRLLDAWARFLKPRLVAVESAEGDYLSGRIRVTVYTEDGEAIPVDVYTGEMARVSPRAEGPRAVYAAIFAYAAATGVYEPVEFSHEDEFARAFDKEYLPGEKERLMARVTEAALREPDMAYRVVLRVRFNTVRGRLVGSGGRVSQYTPFDGYVTFPRATVREEVGWAEKTIVYTLPFRPGGVEARYEYNVRGLSAGVEVVSVEGVRVDPRAKIEMLRKLYEEVLCGGFRLVSEHGRPVLVHKLCIPAGSTYRMVVKERKLGVSHYYEEVDVELQVTVRFKPEAEPVKRVRVRVARAPARQEYVEA